MQAEVILNDDDDSRLKNWIGIGVLILLSLVTGIAVGTIFWLR